MYRFIFKGAKVRRLLHIRNFNCKICFIFFY